MRGSLSLLATHLVVGAGIVVLVLWLGSDEMVLC